MPEADFLKIRFMLFGYYEYEAMGGPKDLLGAFSTREEVYDFAMRYLACREYKLVMLDLSRVTPGEYAKMPHGSVYEGEEI